MKLFATDTSEATGLRFLARESLDAAYQRLARKARGVTNPGLLHLGLETYGGGWWKGVYAGHVRLICVACKHPERAEVVLVVHQVLSHQNEPEYVSFYSHPGNANHVRENIVDGSIDLIEVMLPAGENVTPAPSLAVPSMTDPIRRWLDFTESPRARLIVLGVEDQKLRAVAASLSERELKLESVDVESLTVEEVNVLRLPAEPFNADHAFIVLPDSEHLPRKARDAQQARIDGLRDVVADAATSASSDGEWMASPALSSLASRSCFRLADGQVTTPGPVDWQGLVELDAGQRAFLAAVMKVKPPLLLTGRAGSAKSTLLHYVHAGYCARWIREELPGVPLFVTRSSSLLNQARSRVRALLHVRHHFGGSGDDLANVERCLAEMTTTSQHFSSRVSSQERERFGGVRIDWHWFRAHFYGRWQTGEPVDDGYDLPAKLAGRELSASEAWFVLRALIKGFDASRDWRQADQRMTVAEYVGMPPEFKSVRPAAVERTIETVVPWYASLSGEGFWDDQDLALAALSDTSERRVASVVCDEAQDFTRVELLAVLQSSQFFDLDLARLRPLTLPFVLAGDEQQTLHPTGFRWAEVSSSLYDVTGSAYGMASKRELDTYALDANYRSSQQIVQLANLVQLARSKWLGELADPQVGHRAKFDEAVSAFDQTSADIDDVVGVLRTNVVIAPFDEGRWSEYCKSVDVMQRAFPAVDSASTAPIYSSFDAKGLEFATVVIYGWGAAIGATHEPTLDYRTAMANLYVAVTRARDRLIIVEPEGGIAFWEALSSVEGAGHGRWDHAVPPVLADVDRLGDFIGDEAALIDAIARRADEMADPVEASRAALRYRSIGALDRAALYDARAKRYGGRFAEACAAFDVLGMEDEAQLSLWEGRLHADLALRHADRNETAYRRISISQLLTQPGEPSWTSVCIDLDALLADAHDDDTWHAIAARTAGDWEQYVRSGTGEAVDALDAMIALSPNGVFGDHVLPAAAYLVAAEDAADFIRAITDLPDASRRALLTWATGAIYDGDGRAGVRFLEQVRSHMPDDVDIVEVEAILRGDATSVFVADILLDRTRHLAHDIDRMQSLLKTGV